MKTSADKRVFWYLKDGVSLDLDDPAQVDMYVQQILSHGKTDDIRKMLQLLSPEEFKRSFGRIKRFLPKEVRIFWEEGLGDTGTSTERDSRSP